MDRSLGVADNPQDARERTQLSEPLDRRWPPLMPATLVTFLKPSLRSNITLMAFTPQLTSGTSSQLVWLDSLSSTSRLPGASNAVPLLIQPIQLHLPSSQPAFGCEPPSPFPWSSLREFLHQVGNSWLVFSLPWMALSTSTACCSRPSLLPDRPALLLCQRDRLQFPLWLRPMREARSDI